MGGSRLLFPVVVGAALLVAACGGKASRTVPPEGDGEGPGAQGSPVATGTTAEISRVPLPEPGRLGLLAYVSGGSIWVKPLPDGQAVRLPGTLDASYPRWSPSGHWLAFQRRGELWLMDDSGEAHQLPASGGGEWAPADDRFAYGSAEGDLVIFDARGGPPVTVATKAGGPKWSPDGGTIAFARTSTRPGDLPVHELWTVEVATGRETLVVGPEHSREGYLILVGWSGDGEYILYGQGDVLSASLLADGVPVYAVPAAGGVPRQGSPATLGYADFISLAPRPSNTVALVVGGGRAAWEKKHIALARIPGSATFLSPVAPGAASSPSWAPDGRSIAYVAGPDAVTGAVGGGEDARQLLLQRRIFVQRIDPMDAPRKLTNDAGYRDEWPLWSADGSTIVFARLDRQDSASLWMVPAAGGTPSQLANDLGPFNSPAATWFGYYGHLGWDAVFDWCQP